METKKTIYYNSIGAYISEWNFITETEFSVIGRSGIYELAFAKRDENKKWSWSLEGIQNSVEKNKEIQAKIDNLKLELQNIENGKYN